MKMSLPLVIPRVVLVLALAAGGAHAQKSGPPPLSSPPARGAWTVSYDEKVPKKEEPSQASETGGMSVAQDASVVTKREFSVDGEKAKCVTHYSDGRKLSAFVLGSLGIVENPDKPGDLYVENYAVAYFSTSDFRRNFVGLEWVRPASYKGVVDLDGVKCHYFHETGDSPASAGGQAPAGPRNSYLAATGGREAWLLGNGRPLQARDRGIVAKYTFQPPGEVAAIDIPARFQEKAQRYLDALNPKEKAYSGNR